MASMTPARILARIWAWRAHAPLLSRIVAALLDGYALAALGSVALLALPIPAPEAVIADMLVSFLLYSGAAIWGFAVRSARRA